MTGRSDSSYRVTRRTLVSDLLAYAQVVTGRPRGGPAVNGPGESKHANIGISLPGTFEDPVAPVFVDGRLDRTLRGEGLVDEFIGILEAYVERRYPAVATSHPA